MKNRPEFIDDKLFEVEVKINRKFITKESSFVVGLVSLAIKEYVISDNNKIRHSPELKNGFVWYTRKDLAENKFSFNAFHIESSLNASIHMLINCITMCCIFSLIFSPTLKWCINIILGSILFNYIIAYFSKNLSYFAMSD